MPQTDFGYAIDTSAWIEFFRGVSEQGEKTRNILLYQSTKERIFTPAIILGEMRKKYLEFNYDDERFNEDLGTIENLSRIININKEIAIRAGELRAIIEVKSISLIDCILIAVGEKYNCKVVSTDKHFNSLENCIWLGTPPGDK